MVREGCVATGIQRRGGGFGPVLAVAALLTSAPAWPAPNPDSQVAALSDRQAGSTSARSARHHFVIPAEPAQAALIDLAIQANISIGGSPRCTGRAAGLSGVFTDDEALARLLTPTSCDFRRVAPDVYRIVQRASPERPAP